MQNNIKTRGNLYTELWPPLNIFLCDFDCLATCENSEAQVSKINDFFKRKIVKIIIIMSFLN